MNVLWVFAHPERRSLNGALKDAGLAALTSLGHEVRVSDLYAMGWKATVDAGDFPHHQPDERLAVPRTSAEAHRNGVLSSDIAAEQEKLRWADTVVVQFPLWWYGMPAILKGWFDRVFVKGFAYGVRDPRHPGRTLRYGEGNLAGKRALTVVTAGSPPSPLGPRGLNGQLDLVLFPLLHGTLWYTGMTVLPPFAVYGADRIGEEEYVESAAALRTRLARLDHEEPLPYRSQNGGDYDADLVLREGLAPGETGLGVHYAGGAYTGSATTWTGGCRAQAS
jgi:NAD(P)H dehydrogenase (quinone)